MEKGRGGEARDWWITQGGEGEGIDSRVQGGRGGKEIDLRVYWGEEGEAKDSRLG